MNITQVSLKSLWKNLATPKKLIAIIGEFASTSEAALPAPFHCQSSHILQITTLRQNLCLKCFPKALKYWVGVQCAQSYLMGRRCLFSLVWPPFQRWYHNKNTLWGRCFIRATSLAPHLFLLGWLKLNDFIVRSVETGLGI